MNNSSESDVAYAEKSSRRRAALAIVLPVLLLQQVAFATGEHGARAVDMVRLGSWVVMASALLMLLLTGGSLFRRRAVRALMNDEVTLQHRASAIRFGFTLAMVTAIASFALEALRPGTLPTLAVLHLIVSLSLAGALIRFGVLERRSLG